MLKSLSQSAALLTVGLIFFRGLPEGGSLAHAPMGCHAQEVSR